MRTVKPYSSPADLLPLYDATKEPIVSHAVRQLGRAPDEDLLFAVRPLRGGGFAYEGINEAFGALLGISSREVPGLNISRCMGWEDSESVCDVLQACLARKTETRVHHSLTLGGFRRDVETTVIPVLDRADGAIVRLVGNHRILHEESEWEPDNMADLRNCVSLATIQEGIQQRIASELHDSTCQHLVAASLGLMRIRACLGSAKAHESICDDVDASIDEALREIRSLTYLLHPQSLMVEGLKATIECYAHGFAARTLLRVSLGIDAGVDRLSYDCQHAMLRIVQEGLTNIFRHANATEVRIVADVTDRQHRLTIGDNGRGLSARRGKDGTKAALMGVGIPAMRARVKQLGGKLEIRSDPTKSYSGTTLCAVFPHRARLKRDKRRFAVRS